MGNRIELWTRDEDVRLIHVTESYPHESWDFIAKEAELSRSGKSCSERWNNHLRPGLNKGPFSKDEDLIIVGLQEFIENDWSGIAAVLPGRSNRACRNRWNSLSKKASSSVQEDQVESKIESKMAELAAEIFGHVDPAANSSSGDRPA